MAEDEHLLLLQSGDVHIGHLGHRCPLGERPVVHARNHVIRITRGAVEQRALHAQVAPRDIAMHDDILAEQRPVEAHHVGLAAVQDRDPVPGARPHAHVDQVLEVAQVLLGIEHAAEVIGRAEDLQTLLGGGADVLLDRRIGVARVQRMRMHIAQNRITHHGPLSQLRYSSISDCPAGSESTTVSYPTQYPTRTQPPTPKSSEGTMNGLVDHRAAYSAEEPALPTASDPRLRTRGMKRAAKELLSRVFTYAKPSTANTSAPMRFTIRSAMVS